MKKRIALFLTLVVTLTVTFIFPQPAYAIDDTPLPNMPTANCPVLAIAPDGAGGVYIGGCFTELTPASGGAAVMRNRIAHVNADGSIDPAWNPDANSTVGTLAVSGSTVYAGGDFSNIGGQTRGYIAALDASTGLATTWNPNANDRVLALAVSGSTVYAGGSFTNIGGQTRNRIAALNATTGNATAWNPNANYTVETLAVSGSTVYAGGSFTNIGGQTRNRIAALNATTGNATAWNPNANDWVRSLAVSGSTLYVGGWFTQIGGASRSSFAAFGGLDLAAPTVASQTLQASYIGMGPSSFSVTFSEDVSVAGGAAGANSATNPNNYVVMEQGAISGFQTTACNAIDAVQDTRVTPRGVTYIPNTAIVNLGSALPNGNYRLFVCGTTSIEDLAGNHLNNDVDVTFDFTVGASGGSGSWAKRLPNTGFAPNVITRLSAQPEGQAYAKMSDLWLEIPSQKIKANIVGVPQSGNIWEVKWLGQDVGWLNGTTFPTWEGNSVLTAHVTGADGLPGPFAKLGELRYGDRIIVHMGDQQYMFEIRNSRLARPTSTSYAFEHLEDYSYLTLVTCSGYNEEKNTYNYRRLLRAVLVEVK